MHFPRAFKGVLFTFSFLIFSFGLAQYTNAQTGSWFNWDDVVPDMLREWGVQNPLVIETEVMSETTEREPVIETDEVVEGEAIPVTDEDEGVIVLDETTSESEAVPPTADAEVVDEPQSSEEKSKSEQTADSCQEATTPEEDGIVDEDNWKCQEAAMEEAQPVMRAMAAPMAMSLAAAPTGLTATLDSLNSQNFPFIYLNTRVSYDDTPVMDLQASAFQCTENSTQQTLTVTPPQIGGNVRLADVVFLIDASGSMGGEINDVRNNIVAFANGLATSDVDFRLGLVQFGQSANGGNPMVFGGGSLTNDIVLFKSYVDQLRASGGYEPGFAAMRTAAQTFNFRPGAQKVFLIVTDEDSDDRVKTGTISLMQANDIVVHAAAYCSSGASQSDYCNDTSVRAATGGLLFPVAGPYSDVLDTIVTQTASTYVLRYKSTNPSFDGTTRDVVCTITRNGDQTTIQDSYIPGSAPKITLSPQTELLNESTLPEDSPDAIIRVKVVDDVQPAVATGGVKLYYRTTGAPTYSVLTMSLHGEYYEATIPVVKRYGIDYYVTATDGQQTSSLPSIDPSITPFNIAVLPNVAPAITHTPITTATPNVPLTVHADVVDTTNSVASVELNYRNVGELSYTTLPMGNTTGDTYEATIPAGDMTDDVEYYLYAKDDYGVAAFKGTKDDPFMVTVGQASGAFSLAYSTEQGFDDGANDPLNSNFAVHPDRVPQKLNTRPITFKAVYTYDSAPDSIYALVRQEKDLTTDEHLHEMATSSDVQEALYWRDISEIFSHDTGRVIGMKTPWKIDEDGFDGNESLLLELPGAGKSEVAMSFVTVDAGIGFGSPRATLRLEAFDAHNNPLGTDTVEVILGAAEVPELSSLHVRSEHGDIDHVLFSISNTDESETWISGITVYEQLDLLRDTSATTTPELRDGDYTNGEQYVATSTFASRGDYEVQIVASTTDGQVATLPDIGWLPFSIKELFVYVALGDSYQSGEGVGNSYTSAEYGEKAYENGSNAKEYYEKTEWQEDTYTDEYSEGGNTCHRALSNYAKLFVDEYDPNVEVILIDRTCSGGTIEINEDAPDVKTIVGDVVSDEIDSNSQLQAALTRLSSVGLAPEDVNLVTVGMGGNDALFAEFVQACLTPTLVSRLLESHADLSPDHAFEHQGLLMWIADLDTCQSVVEDSSIGQGDDSPLAGLQDAVDALAGKAIWAQDKILTNFPNAQVLQLNYPVIVPEREAGMEWCTGLRLEDLNYARDMAADVNGAIDEAVRDSQHSDRLTVVDVRTALSGNPICPLGGGTPYANGLSRAQVDHAVLTLLGDTVVMNALNDAADFWNESDLLSCTIQRAWFGDQQCDDVMRAEMMNRLQPALDKFDTPAAQRDLIASFILPDDQQESGEQYDRSRGLFHPNREAHELLACHMDAVRIGSTTPYCPINENVDVARNVNGARVDYAPIDAAPGDEMQVEFAGFQPNSSVDTVFLSTPIPLETVVADENGTVDIVVTLPEASPGVHTLQLRGMTSYGVGVWLGTRIHYAGRPVGGTEYVTYLCGLPPTPEAILEPGDTEHVDVYTYGEKLGTYQTDKNGCVLVDMFVYDILNNSDDVTIEAISQSTGSVVTEVIHPIPSITGLWTTSNKRKALSITGANTRISGKVHSESDIIIMGAGITLSEGPEYVTRMRVLGMNDVPEGQKVDSGGLPTTYDIASYRPGGSEALKAGDDYHAIPRSSCKWGTWTVAARNIPDGLVYVPCSVNIVGANATVNAQIIAEKNIQLSGTDITIDPAHVQNPALVSNASVHVSGTGTTIDGTIQALSGTVKTSGVSSSYRCGIVANEIVMTGANNTVVIDGSCWQ